MKHAVSTDVAARALERLLPDASERGDQLREPDLQWLSAIYLAWCRAVPFDNALRYLAVNGDADADPLPGLAPNDFFDSWLRFGCGGMCVPATSAFLALLEGLGFQVGHRFGRLGDGTEPDHVSGVVSLPQGNFLVDTVCLNEQPVALMTSPRVVGRAPHRVTSAPTPEGWMVEWLSSAHRTPQRLNLLREDGGDGFRDLYAETQASSVFRLFNRMLYARINKAQGIMTVIGDNVTFTDRDGRTHLESRHTRDVLETDFGWSSELVGRLVDAKAFR